MMKCDLFALFGFYGKHLYQAANIFSSGQLNYLCCKGFQVKSFKIIGIDENVSQVMLLPIKASVMACGDHVVSFVNNCSTSNPVDH